MKKIADMLSHKPSSFVGELLRDGLISYGVSRALDDIEIIGLSVKILSQIHPIKMKGGDKKESH